MRRKKIVVAFIFIIAALVWSRSSKNQIMYVDNTAGYNAVYEEVYQDKNPDIDFNNLIKPYIVSAEFKKQGYIYSSCSGVKIKKVGKILKGEKVQILEDRNFYWYLVRKDKITGWVTKEYLSISKETSTNQNTLTREQIEGYANKNNFTSNTNYFIWVDIDRQKTYVLTKNNNEWILIKSMNCATGKNISPTIRGAFTVTDRGDSFYSNRFKEGAKYWIRFNDNYLFHSITYDKNGNIKDKTLGKRISHGCVRLGINDIKYLYYDIPYKTAVYIN